MQGLAPSDSFLFEDFRLDRRGGLFRRDNTGAFVPVAIGSRARHSRRADRARRRGRLQGLWPGTVVEDSNLTVQISALRRVLDRGRPNRSCIQTVPGRGYRLAAAVTPFADQARSGVPPVHGARELKNERTVENLVPPVTDRARPGVASDWSPRKPAAARRRLGADALRSQQRWRSQSSPPSAPGGCPRRRNSRPRGRRESPRRSPCLAWRRSYQS